MDNKKLTIKQFAPHHIITGLHVKEAENSLTRAQAIMNIASVFERNGIGGKTPKSAAELAIDVLLGVEE